MADEAEKLLDAAVSALQKGEMQVCISLTSQALQILPENDSRVPEALSLRGTAYMRTDPDAGFEDLRLAVQMDPGEPQFQTALGQAYMTLGQFHEAETALHRAWQQSKGHMVVGVMLGRALLAQGKGFQATQLLGPIVQSGKAQVPLIRLFAEALYASGDVFSARDVLSQLFGRAGPQTSQDRLQFARIDMALRDYGSAEARLQDLLKSDPASVPALMSSVRLMDWMDKREMVKGLVARLSDRAGDQPEAFSLIVDHSETLPEKVLQHAEAVLATNTPKGEEQAALGFSLALYFDRKKDFERAFRIASETNARLSKFRKAIQTPEVIEARRLRLQTDLSHASRLYRESAGIGVQENGQRFVYLVGAPRTGSSLIQSILAAPDGVDSVGERGALYPYLAEVMARPTGPEAFARLVRELTEADQAGLKRQGKGAGVIIDKTPHHLYVAGLLQRVNPNAQFVQVFRDAGDVALSMFLRPFSGVFPEATDLTALADLLTLRLETSDHWKTLGLEITPFSYEAFTRAPETEGARLFQTLSLEWREDYLDPSARPDAVPTFSSRQVRQPIRSKPAPHWKNYAAFAPEAFADLEKVTERQNAHFSGNEIKG